jgi:hypothetical protein
MLSSLLALGMANRTIPTGEGSNLINVKATTEMFSKAALIISCTPARLMTLGSHTHTIKLLKGDRSKRAACRVDPMTTKLRQHTRISTDVSHTGL